jgi:hypothetical protein
LAWYVEVREQKGRQIALLLQINMQSIVQLRLIIIIFTGNSLDGRGYHDTEDGEEVCPSEKARQQSQKDWG